MNAKVFIAVIFGLALLSAIINSGGSSSSTTSSNSVNTGSSEYNYARNRFRAEGFSDADSRKAAEAVIKFNQAQQRR